MINYYLPTDEYVILILILTIITMINYYLPTEYVIPIFFYYQNMKSFTNAFNANDTNSKVWRSDHQHEKHYKQVRKCWEDKSVSVSIISNLVNILYFNWKWLKNLQCSRAFWLCIWRSNAEKVWFEKSWHKSFDFILWNFFLLEVNSLIKKDMN